MSGHGHYSEVCEVHVCRVGGCKCPGDKEERLVPCPGAGLCRGVPVPNTARQSTLCATCALPIRWSDLIQGWTHIGFLHPTAAPHTARP